MIPLYNKKLLIFDCDGVLFDSHDANIDFFNTCLMRGGYPRLDPKDREKVAYMSTRQLMNELFPDHLEADRLFKISQETDYTPFIPALVPLFDFERVFGRLQNEYHLAMATNRGRSLDKLFNHFRLERWFGYRVSTVDAEPKPHPEMLLKCIEFFNVAKNDALFIGDAKSDRDAAINAGIDYIRVGLPGEGQSIESVADLI